MARKKIFVTGVILLAVCIGFGAYLIGRNAKKNLSLENFRQDGEYQYLQLEWGTSVEDAKKLLKTSMESAYELKVPLDVELSEANNWYEAK